MKSTIYIEGILGSQDSSTEQVIPVTEPQKNITKQITNVQVTTSYPKTGELQIKYLLFSGVCLLLLLLLVKKRKTTD